MCTRINETNGCSNVEVKQGYVMSLWLINIYMEVVMIKLNEGEDAKLMEKGIE